MAEEYKRKRARVSVSLPTGDTIDIPVITEIAFVDPFERAQETIYTVDNTRDSDRTVHVDSVKSSTDPQGRSISVERIDVWPVLDPFDRSQETQVEFDNKTGADTTPPSFTTHLKTHVIKYTKPGSSDIWVKSELIDSFTVVDPFERGQETEYTLDNPADGDAEGAQADPEDPLLETGSPYRTDPFQNLVDWSGRTQPDTVLSPRNVGIGMICGSGMTPDPTEFCNGSTAVCSINHPEGWPPGGLSYCGPGYVNHNAFINFLSSYTPPFTGPPPDYAQPQPVTTITAGPSGEGYGHLTGSVSATASGGTLTMHVGIEVLTGRLCGQFEFPGSFTNAVFWPLGGSTDIEGSASLPATFTWYGEVFSGGKAYNASSVYTVGALVQVGADASSGVPRAVAVFTYNPGPISLGSLIPQ